MCRTAWPLDLSRSERHCSVSLLALEETGLGQPPPKVYNTEARLISRKDTIKDMVLASLLKCIAYDSQPHGIYFLDPYFDQDGGEGVGMSISALGALSPVSSVSVSVPSKMFDRSLGLCVRY